MSIYALLVLEKYGEKLKNINHNIFVLTWDLFLLLVHKVKLHPCILLVLYILYFVHNRSQVQKKEVHDG